jgi:hypothetical protein
VTVPTSGFVSWHIANIKANLPRGHRSRSPDMLLLLPLLSSLAANDTYLRYAFRRLNLNLDSRIGLNPAGRLAPSISEGGYHLQAFGPILADGLQNLLGHWLWQPASR